MKLYWGSSVGRGYEPDHVVSLVAFFAKTPYPTYFKPVHGDALIERSRAKSATAFLASDAEVWLSVDSDIVFHWQDLVTLAEQAVTYDIMVGAYTTRSVLHTFPTSLIELGEPVEFGTDPLPVPIRWGATGFMAVHRRVFEALAQRDDMPLCHAGDPHQLYPFFLPFTAPGPDGTTILLSEDWAFCERARQNGFGIWLNPAVRLGHVGPYCYRLEDLSGSVPAPGPVRVTRETDTFPARYRVETPAAAAILS